MNIILLTFDLSSQSLARAVDSFPIAGSAALFTWIKSVASRSRSMKHRSDILADPTLPACWTFRVLLVSVIAVPAVILVGYK